MEAKDSQQLEEAYKLICEKRRKRKRRSIIKNKGISHGRVGGYLGYGLGHDHYHSGDSNGGGDGGGGGGE